MNVTSSRRLFKAGILSALVVLLAWSSGVAETPLGPTAFLLSGVPQKVPVEGTVTLVNFGSATCPPCRAMAPFIEDLSRLYEGRVVMIYIDVEQYRAEAVRYNIQAIPTQIIYDATGKEYYRHTGFLDKSAIVAKLAELENK